MRILRFLIFDFPEEFLLLEFGFALIKLYKNEVVRKLIDFLNQNKKKQTLRKITKSTFLFYLVVLATPHKMDFFRH